MNIFKFYPLLFVLLVSSCTLFSSQEEKEVQKIYPSATNVDAHSYANISKINTVHLSLELDVNFKNKSIYGVARHQMHNTGVDTAIFDIKGLDIQKVTLGKKGSEINTDFVIGKEDSILGAPLSVKILDTTKLINIYYKTTEFSDAIDWLDPNMTQGKKHPFLYTQGQAILTRTWIPTQDTPSNRITYSADVTVPKELLPLMSAENPIAKNDSGSYHFEMKQAIPVYLIALTVGNLEYRKLGKDCGVYAEPELIRQAAWEFNDLRKMIVAAESIYGKYQWGQYDVVMLPYSFPFGGMENPRLTFANPTLIAGDRSLVSVIAHELAHSWSGNLVTNASWDDFWLNEGFTVYFEQRIMEKLYGKDVSDMLAIIEFQELEAEIAEMNKGDHPNDSFLKIDLAGRNPDDGMTTIPYVKGAFFLKTLEELVGREKFDVFMKSYFKKFQFKTVNTEEFIAFLDAQLLKPYKLKFNTNEWIYERGIPKNCVRIESERLNAAEKMAKDLVDGKDIFSVRKKKKKFKLKREDLTTQEWIAFIRALPRDLPNEKMELVDKKLRFKTWSNSEVATEWFVLGIESNYKAIQVPLDRFLNKVGRRKYLLPLYKSLAKNPEDLLWAQEVYLRARPNYHAISKSTVDELLGYKSVVKD
jgi:leukotriene-A4 hydrolase